MIITEVNSEQKMTFIEKNLIIYNLYLRQLLNKYLLVFNMGYISHMMEKFTESEKIIDFNWEEGSISFNKIKKPLINIKLLKN